MSRQRCVLLLLLLLALTLPLGCGGGSEPAAVPPETGGLQLVTPRSSASAKGPSPAAPAKAKAAGPAGVAARIAFVNVGQGDAILVKSGKTDVLVDGGPEGSHPAVSAAMRKLGMRELDTVVVSHSHADHIGATDDLARRYAPERILLAGAREADLRSAARGVGAKTVQVRRGDTVRWGAVKAKVVSPKSISDDANADSVVLLLEVAGRRLLLTGDLTGANEAIVGALCARGPPLDVLKVAHHGSAYSTSAGFLADADPRTAIISVGANPYGHPTRRTVARLRSSGARVYTTRRNGTITLTVSRSGALSWRFGKTARPLN